MQVKSGRQVPPEIVILLRSRLSGNLERMGPLGLFRLSATSDQSLAMCRWCCRSWRPNLVSLGPLRSWCEATGRTLPPPFLHVGGILRRPDTAQPGLCSIVSVTGPLSLVRAGWQGIMELC